MKKRTIFLTTALCVASMAAGVAANGLITEIKAQLRPDFTIEIDGVKREFKTVEGEKVYPILHEGTTYLPLRAISEIMGKTVYWYEDEKRIEIKDSEKITVTDADVIISGEDNKEKKEKPEKNEKPVKEKEKNEKEKIDDKKIHHFSPVVDTSQFIGEEKAKEIALKKAGLSAGEVKFERVELDKDNGVWHYEVEFKKDRTEYDADIKAENGDIISWEVDKE